MWCISCRQDVVGIRSEAAGRYECPRCKGILCDRMAEALECGDSLPLSVAPQVTDLPDPPALDTWELDEQLRHVARILGVKATGSAGSAHARVDPSQPGTPGWHRAGPRRDPRGRLGSRGWRSLVALLGSVFAWLGVTALTCGVSLLGWAEVGVRAELQVVGLLIGIGGILMLALGMTLRLDQSSSRSASLPTHRRIDRESWGPGSGPHACRAAGRKADKAA